MATVGLRRRGRRRQWLSYEPGHRYIRRVKGRAYQARVWLASPPFGSVNLGTFAGDPDQDDVVGERMAARVSDEYDRRAKAVGADAITVFVEMQREGKIPERVLPPGAYRRRDGLWGARRRFGKTGPVVRVGPFPTAEEASRALGQKLVRVMLWLDRRRAAALRASAAVTTPRRAAARCG